MEKVLQIKQQIILICTYTENIKTATVNNRNPGVVFYGESETP